jgi:hypothetical protein
MVCSGHSQAGCTQFTGLARGGHVDLRARAVAVSESCSIGLPGEAADLAVAQPVKHEAEQFPCGSHPGDHHAPTLGDARERRGDGGAAVVAGDGFDRRQRTSVEPCLVRWPRWTLVSDSLTSEVGGLRLDAAVSEGMELPLADLAAGLLRQWALGTTLREWAAVVLMLSDVQFQEAESPDEDRLLDAVWSASAGEPVPDDALRLARQLALGAYCRSRAASLCTDGQTGEALSVGSVGIRQSRRRWYSHRAFAVREREDHLLGVVREASEKRVVREHGIAAVHTYAADVVGHHAIHEPLV